MTYYNPIAGALADEDLRRRIRAEITRPANVTAYAAGDVVGADASTVPITLADVARKLGGSGEIVHVSLETNNVTVTNGTFAVHFFTASFTVAADNAAFADIHAQRANWVGSVSLPILVADSASAGGAWSKVDNVRIPFVCAGASDDLFAVIVVTGAYTPASGQVFSLSIGVLRD